MAKQQKTSGGARKKRHATSGKVSATRKKSEKLHAAEPLRSEETLQERKERAQQIAESLAEAYPDARCALHHRNAYELLVATILSAQCTDERVNQVTPALFAQFPDARSLAAAPRDQLERMIQSTGYYRAKAKNLQECCQQLVERYDGQVPRSLEALVELPGIGRKTANVVLGTAYGIPTGIVVDTHVARIVQRLGLTAHKDPTKIERDLMELLPQSKWIDFAHRLIHHGRRICKARRPLCTQCPLDRLCPKIGVSAETASSRTSPKPSSRQRHSN